MIQKSIFLFIDGNYMIYRKDFDGTWQYSALADGNPPKPVAINEEEFITAEQLFRNDLQNEARIYLRPPVLSRASQE